MNKSPCRHSKCNGSYGGDNAITVELKEDPDSSSTAETFFACGKCGLIHSQDGGLLRDEVLGYFFRSDNGEVDYAMIPTEEFPR